MDANWQNWGENKENFLVDNSVSPFQDGMRLMFWDPTNYKLVSMVQIETTIGECMLI